MTRFICDNIDVISFFLLLIVVSFFIVLFSSKKLKDPHPENDIEVKDSEEL